MNAIDVHGHFGISDDGTGNLAGRMMTGGIEVVRQRAQSADIRFTVVSSLTAFMPYGGNVLRANEESRQAAEQHADIFFWAVLNPLLPESFKQVETLLRHPRCKGIKIHPTQHEYEIRDHGEAIFEFAAAQQAIVTTHSGCARSYPEEFVRFANRYPSVRLILAHLGHSADGNYTRQVCALKRAEAGNVYVDTSSAKSMISGLLEWAVSEIGDARILFGTDTPLYFSPCQKARVEYAGIDEASKRAILYDNAARLLNLGNY